MLLYHLVASSLCLTMRRDDNCQRLRTFVSSNASRRKLLTDALGRVTVAATTVVASPLVGHAEDPLFRPNPLTNKVLEKMRIMDQQYADNIKYDGELAAASADIRTTYANLLVPILSIQEGLRVVNKAIHEPDGSSLSKAQAILSQPQFQVKELKRMFNAFADNIYYSDPDRANLYLAGGATPKTSQSLAYLLRNEVLTSIDELRTEIADLLEDQEKNESKIAIDYSDVIEYGKKCNDAMNEYLALVPPEELKMAQIIMENTSNQK